MNREPVTLVLPGGPQIRHAWETVYGFSRPVLVKESAAQNLDSIRNAYNEEGFEVCRIVLDQSVDAAGFLSFTARLPFSFSGDVVWIREEGGFVSSAAPDQQGRFLFEMSRRDLAHYLDVHFAAPSGRLAAAREAMALGSSSRRRD